MSTDASLPLHTRGANVYPTHILPPLYPSIRRQTRCQLLSIYLQLLASACSTSASVDCNNTDYLTCHSMSLVHPADRPSRKVVVLYVVVVVLHVVVVVVVGKFGGLLIVHARGRREARHGTRTYPSTHPSIHLHPLLPPRRTRRKEVLHGSVRVSRVQTAELGALCAWWWWWCASRY